MSEINATEARSPSTPASRTWLRPLLVVVVVVALLLAFVHGSIDVPYVYGG